MFYTWGLKKIVWEALHKFAAIQGYESIDCKTAEDISTLTINDKVSVPLEKVVLLIALLRKQRFSGNIEVMAILPSGFIRNTANERFDDGVLVTYIAEDEAISLLNS